MRQYCRTVPRYRARHTTEANLVTSSTGHGAEVAEIGMVLRVPALWRGWKGTWRWRALPAAPRILAAVPATLVPPY
eukprot:2287003-Rhodomonas_salina.1